MYRLFVIAASLLILIASSAALTVVGTKPAGFTPIRPDIDLGPSAESRHRMGPSSFRRGASSYGPMTTTQSFDACCSYYPYCGCPKLETPKRKPQNFYYIKLPAQSKNGSDSTCSCCPDYPFCDCPKL